MNTLEELPSVHSQENVKYVMKIIMVPKLCFYVKIKIFSFLSDEYINQAREEKKNIFLFLYWVSAKFVILEWLSLKLMISKDPNPTEILSKY